MKKSSFLLNCIMVIVCGLSLNAQSSYKIDRKINLPTAEFEAAPAGSNQRPAIKPNTFTILDIATLK